MTTINTHKTNSNYNKCITALSSIRGKYPRLLSAFSKWYKDGMWDSEGLTDEFTEDIEDCSFIDCMKDSHQITSESQAAEIFQLLHAAITSINIAQSHTRPTIDNTTTTAYEQRKSRFPKDRSIVVSMLSGMDTMTKTDMKKMQKRFAKQAPKLLNSNTSAECEDLLYIEYIGYKHNNYPLLLHFVDSYIRYRLNQWIITGVYSTDSISDFFYAQCANVCFKHYLFNHQKSGSMLTKVKTAIKSHQHRLLIPFQSITPAYKIRKNPLKICDYIFEMTRIVRTVANIPIYNLTQSVPIQIDFMIINGDTLFECPDMFKCGGIEQLFDSDDDDADEDMTMSSYNTSCNTSNESKYAEQDSIEDNIAVNIDKLLKQNGRKKGKDYFTYDNEARWNHSIAHMKQMNKNERCKRNVFVLDTRKQRLSTDTLYLLRPKKKYGSFEKNKQELIHSSLQYNSVKSMLPRDGRKTSKDFGVRDSLRGQMFVLSYHIMSKDEIRCYLFYQGQYVRFYGEDLVNLLPQFFENTAQARKMMLQRYNSRNGEWRGRFDEFCDSFKDDSFDKFYHGLVGREPRIGVVTRKK